ncbi:MAG TPA: GNAT family N-acetyltransferase [Solirubrobacterales bacterium]|nr:GNAT family N-acetyltransferase [Solirubrobacterales bacterium]
MTGGLSASTVDSLTELASAELRELETSAGAYLSFERWRDLEQDARWQTRYVVVRRDTGLLALLPLSAPAKGAWSFAAYDPRALLGESASGTAERDWLLVGGRADLACGLLRAPGLDDATLVAAAELAGGAARADPLAHQRRLAALYVGADERDAIARVLGPAVEERVVGTEARLAVVGNGRGDHLASLSSSHRNVVRRDWRDRDAAELATRSTGWEEVIDEAAGLIADVSRGHGHADHPVIVRARLEPWLAHREIEPVAFVVSARERTLAIALGWRWRDLLQVYEVGLVSREVPARHLAYVEAMVYAPLRWAADRGCREITLGLAASEPKRLRGAELRPVHAIASTAAIPANGERS